MGTPSDTVVGRGNLFLARLPFRYRSGSVFLIWEDDCWVQLVLCSDNWGGYLIMSCVCFLLRKGGQRRVGILFH